MQIKFMEVEKKKRKRIKGKKIGSSGPVIPYPVQDEMLMRPRFKRTGINFEIKKSSKVNF